MEKKVSNLTLAPASFANSRRASQLTIAGCEAQLEGCQRALVVHIAIEAGADPETTPAWALHPLCGACAVALGLK